MENNHYLTLGISTYSDIAEVREAYHMLVKKWHPDKWDDAHKQYAQQRFSEINRAYEVLGNQENKKKYDEEKKSIEMNHMYSDDSDNESCESSESSESTESSISSASSEITHEQFLEYIKDLSLAVYGKEIDTSALLPKKEADRQYFDYMDIYKPKGGVLEMCLPVTLEEIFTGVEKIIKISRMVTVNNKEDVRLDVTIRRNAEENETITVTKKGNFVQSNFLMAKECGDVVIHIKIQKHHVFTRIGYDLHANMKISYNEAVNGFERKIVDLNNNEYIVKMDKLNSSTDTFVIENAGLQIDDDECGDIVVKFEVDFNKVDEIKKAKKVSKKI